MAQNFYGSICLTDLIESANKKHSAFSKSANGKIYANITIWHNDEEDKFGNTVSIQLNPTKEMKEIDGRPYIGNAKESKGPQPLKGNESFNVTADIPVRESNSVAHQIPDAPTTGENQDLPF